MRDYFERDYSDECQDFRGQTREDLWKLDGESRKFSVRDETSCGRSFGQKATEITRDAMTGIHLDRCGGAGTFHSEEKMTVHHKMGKVSKNCQLSCQKSKKTKK